MSKVIKYLAFFLIFLFIMQLATAQTDFNFGQPANGPVSSRGMQINSDGFHPPLTRKEEKARREALRISLTNNDVMILLRKQNGKELTFWQKVQYPFIKMKKNKLDKLKAQSNTAKSNSDTTGHLPNYLSNGGKNDLTIKERDILDKKDKQNEELTPEEEKIYKKAIRKQAKLNKLKQKYQKIQLTEDEENLLKKSRRNINSLTPEEKNQLDEIKKKQKHNDKIDQKIRTQAIDSAYKTGDWLPTTPKKYRWLNLLPKFKQTKERPSSYVRKMRRYNRLYSLTDNEKIALNNRNSGVKMNPLELATARRAASKDYTLKVKIRNLEIKEYLKYQPKESRKRMRKLLKH